MKREEIKLGAVYRMGARDVRIEVALIRGWSVRDMRTGNIFRLRTAGQLKFEVIPVDNKSRAAGERDE